MEFKEKLKLLRKTECYTQKKISELLKSTEISIRNYESGRREPNHEFMEKLCKQFPEYTLWLMTGQTSGDQIDPYIKAEKSTKTA